MHSRLGKWIDERWPVTALIRLTLDEDMPGGDSYAYVFGSASLIVFLIQAVTGIMQLFYYVPTLSHAYDSLNYLRTEVPFGWLIHGLHYWGASAMIILVTFHLSQVFIWGAYKRPHELQWLTGVFLLLTTMGLSLTGGVIPWDKRGYWVVEVASSAAGTVPLLGDAVKRLMIGGEVIGQLTLSRFFVVHTAILPAFLMLLVAVHVIALRRAGSAGPWDEVKRRTSGPFWPGQVFKDAVAGTIVFFLLIALAVLVPAPISGMADPMDTLYVPKPEWNFLFLYEALKYFPGPLEPIATVGIPIIGTIVLLLIPFWDANPERNPARRPLAMAGYCIVATALIALTVAGAYSKPAGEETGGGPPAPLFPAAITPEPSSIGVERGAMLFQSVGCMGCHRINGAGGAIGPDLSGEGIRARSRQFLTTQIVNPQANAPVTVMPPFASLPPDQVRDLVDYLLNLKSVQQTATPGSTAPMPRGSPGQKPTGRAATITGSAEHGSLLFAKNCIACHGPEGTDKVPNHGSDDGTVPSLNPLDRELYNADPQIFAAAIDRYLQHGSMPAGSKPALYMLPFGDNNDLTQAQIADIEAYVLQLNGVDRARLNHPGVAPEYFLAYVTVALILTVLVLAGLWRKMCRKEKGKP